MTGVILRILFTQYHYIYHLNLDASLDRNLFRILSDNRYKIAKLIQYPR